MGRYVPAVKRHVADTLACCAHGERTATAKRLASLYGVSVATIYRWADRRGAKRPRVATKPEYRDWVRLAVRLAHRAPKRLPLGLVLDAAIASGALPAEARRMPLRTAHRIARELSLRHMPKRTHRMHADYPMQALQIDASSSKYLVVDRILSDGDYRLRLQDRSYSSWDHKKVPKQRLRVIVYAVWDMCTGYTLARYTVAKGENALDAMNFLCWALAGKDDPRIPFHGVPDDLWSDQGPLLKSAAARDLLSRLGIRLVTGAPHAKERMGGVEQTHRNRWARFERALFLRNSKTITLSGLNDRLQEFDVRENGRRLSRTRVEGRSVSRTAAWVALTNRRSLDNLLRRLPPNPISTLAREARRKVDRNGILRWEGVEYELERLHSCWVIARRSLVDPDIVVVETEGTGQKHAARPYAPRRYGEIAGAEKTPLEKLLETPLPFFVGADVYAVPDNNGNVESLRTLSRTAAPLENSLETDS